MSILNFLSFPPFHVLVCHRRRRRPPARWPVVVPTLTSRRWTDTRFNSNLNPIPHVTEFYGFIYIWWELGPLLWMGLTFFFFPPSLLIVVSPMPRLEFHGPNRKAHAHETLSAPHFQILNSCPRVLLFICFLLSFLHFLGVHEF